MANTNPNNLIPPEESMWAKYSPHYELPLAGATSMFLHGFIIGIMAIGGIAFLFAANLEATKPPSMDVVMVEGDGSGFEGLGGAPGLPGSPDAGGQKRTEQTLQPDQPEHIDKSTPPRLLKDPPIDLGLPLIDDGSTPSPEVSIELAKLGKEADEQIKKAMKIQAQTGNDVPKLPGPKGTGKKKGQGGLGGVGGGPGKGKKKGPGTGLGGGAAGRQGTKQEIYAQRWHFDLSGDAKEHARKLAAIGFTVAFPDPRGGFVVVTDLNRRPVEMRRDNLMGFQEAVRWNNVAPASVQALSRELQIPFVPRFVVLFLPKDREDAMAEAEKNFADRQGLKTITMTRFDFRLRNGAYDPVVISQK